MIVSYFGGLRHTECDSLVIENFHTTTDGVIVTHARAKVSNFSITIMFSIITIMFTAME